ncbi:MAG: peptidylprolyl isomerase [Hyphomicrobiales bacterium]|nr:peptidylprolyl isomerase [Hyphomicrobiales bacterium]
MISRRLALICAATLLAAPTALAASQKDVLHLYTSHGMVTIQLRPDLAPKTVKQIETLTKQGFYNGLKFHRVIAGFMAQTGDPTGTGAGGSKLPNVPGEFNKANFGRGSVGMARTSDPNSGNSQFFICFADSSFLDGKYTNFGQVIHGMKVVDEIKKGAPGTGTVTDPDIIVKMVMAADDHK